MKTVIIRQGYENCKSVFNEKLALDMIPEAKKPDQSKQIITFSLCSLRWTMGEIKWIIVFRHWTGNLKEPFWNGYADKGNKGLCGVFERVHRGFQFSEFKLLLRCQTSNEWAYISKVTWLFFFFSTHEHVSRSPRCACKDSFVPCITVMADRTALFTYCRVFGILKESLKEK